MQEVHLGNLSNVLLAGDNCVNSVLFWKIAKKNTLVCSPSNMSTPGQGSTWAALEFSKCWDFNSWIHLSLTCTDKNYGIFIKFGPLPIAMFKRFYRSAAKMRLSFVELKICLGKAEQFHLEALYHSAGDNGGKNSCTQPEDTEFLILSGAWSSYIGIKTITT